LPNYPLWDQGGACGAAPARLAPSASGPGAAGALATNAWPAVLSGSHTPSEGLGRG
jgi:hypothetical protein